MPGAAALLLLLREADEVEGEPGDAGDGGEQLPSSLHSQHAAASLRCGEGVLDPAAAAVIVLVVSELRLQQEREREARRGSRAREWRD